MYTYLSGTFTEPGVVRRPQPDDEESFGSMKSNRSAKSEKIGEYFQERFCSRCRVMRPPKTSHCYNCNNCVKMYDHHCTFMSNCIGQRNYRYFIGWVYTLVLQCIIWYIVLFQHTYKTFSMQEAMDKLFQSDYVQYAALIFLMSLCCSCTFYLHGVVQSCLTLLFISCFGVFLYGNYDFDKKYYENYFCSLIFVIVTLPGGIMALSVSLSQSIHLAIGVNQKEWSVLTRQVNLNSIRDTNIELSASPNLDQTNQYEQVESQSTDIVKESEEDKQLRQKIEDEIENNPELRGTLSKEKMEYIFQRRRNYQQKQKMVEDAKQQVQTYKSKASLQNYCINLKKLLFDKISQSELY
ncbi:unnamed protein product (macronuclear) [Paramecium tetraurelia]|uniref:Palmitoyltransferase n=1 Tax=Paramecium tetraurelia TaxID=5888 RepID=A0E5Y4_PARTE|nr:uncharacterized protein GSPATT00003564001 [Paramecium tetraurelia]CAK90701.1 unnamed protein product [Paramecium tetraurelia]|eukprot:XP_001458098.1 hypothetical protein (macronuclear) [Paramecium tetraurelia strain d4-2]